MHAYLLDLLECPACHSRLAWTIVSRNGERIETAEAHCQGCEGSYPVREEIGLFLTPDLQRNDLWEQVESELARYLSEHPKQERALMESPLDTLSAADQFFRALVLEERGDYAQARQAEDTADRGLYTTEYRKCRDSQLDDVVNSLKPGAGPVIDLASGRCGLVERLARDLDRPVVATDFSPGVLRSDRRRLANLGLYDRVSLLAFDARRTPFKDGAVTNLTSNLGLQNIEDPGSLLTELRRITSGEFRAIAHFFPEGDEANAAVIQEAGLEKMLYRNPALEQFEAAGWQVEVRNHCVSETKPTPPGVILEGARMDSLPVADTMLEWCVLVGTPRM